MFIIVQSPVRNANNMAGPQAQRPISQHEGTSASRALRSVADSAATHSHHHHSNSGAISAITTAPMPTNGSSAYGGGNSGIDTTAGASGTAAVRDHHIEITVDDEQNQDKDIERGGKKVRHRSHHRRPLYRRVINYIRHAWTGVKFSSSNGKCPLHLSSSLPFYLSLCRYFWNSIRNIYTDLYDAGSKLN